MTSTTSNTAWGTDRQSRVIVIRKWHVALLLLAILIAAMIYYSLDRHKVEVHAITPAYQDIARTISATGLVTPIHDFPARANFGGMVEKIYVHLGDKVHAGQELMLMKDQYALSRLLSAQAALTSTQVVEQNLRNNGSQEDRIGFNLDLQHAQSEQASAADALNTLQQLRAKGSVSDAEVGGGAMRLNAANAALQALEQRTNHRYSAPDLASWKDKVAAAEEALKAEKVSYANAHITTPISGTIYVLPVSQYDFVPEGADLLHVADLTHLQIRADINENDIGALRAGQAVTVRWEGRSNQVWHGHVALAPMAPSHLGNPGAGMPGSGFCLVDIDSPAEGLPVNTNVSITVTLETHAHVLTIPREALHAEGSAHFVYRIAGDKLIKTPVALGLTDALNAEISSGLTPEDRLALYAIGEEKLSNNLRVAAEK